MNLFFKSYRFHLIFFTLITLKSGFSCGLSPEITSYLTPWIQEIKLPSQYSTLPNRSFNLDEFGNIFIGKENGLTIINGPTSSHLHMAGPVYVTSMDSDSIFYVASNDVGYLLRENNSEFRPVSFKDKLPLQLQSFTPSQLLYDGRTFIFNSDRGVYTFNDGRSDYFYFDNIETRIFEVDRSIYVSVGGTGIMQWEDGTFKEILAQNKLGNSHILHLGKVDKLLQILTSSGDLYELDRASNKLVLKALFSNLGQITFIDHLSDGLLLIANVESGIGIYDNAGNQLNLFGGKGGLPLQDLRQVYTGADNEIWVLSDHSLHKIIYPSLLNIMEIDQKIAGRIYASELTDEGILMASSGGILMASINQNNLNTWGLKNLTPNIRESFHLLVSAGDHSFAAGSRSLFNIHQNKVTTLAKGSFTGLISIDEQSVITSNEKGIQLYRLYEKGWSSSVIDPSLTSSHSFISFREDHYFISNNEVYKLSHSLEDLKTIQFRMDELLFKLLLVEEKLYLVGSSKVYMYDEEEETFIFIPWDQKAEILAASDIILPDNQENYWIVQNDRKYSSSVFRTNKLDQFSEDQQFFPVLQNLGDIMDLSIQDNILYVTCKGKIALLDLRILQDDHGPVPLRIDMLYSEETGIINLRTDSSTEWVTDNEEIELTNRNNDVEIYLGGLEYQSDPSPLFRYKLYPNGANWSQWNPARQISLLKLKPGRYTFLAQSKNLFGQVSEPAELLLIIKPPLSKTWYAYTLYSFLLLTGLFLIQKWRLLSNRKVETRVSLRMQTELDNLTIEKAKSDKLAAEFLPERTAEQIKSVGKAKWDKYEKATVLFSDIQGFTKIAEEMNPEVLIDELDKFFFHFDSVVEKYNIEKIKTIGDAYMAAGGIPMKNSTNPVEVVLAALEMKSFMQQLKTSKTDIWDLRIGIHTGPVIAGVVGHKKVSYDIWGDTVNTASRMESSGMPGKVNISGITYGMVKEYFICEYRGKLPVKYKGNIDMYFVTGLRPELSVDLKEIPNRRFFMQLQLLRLGDLEEKVLDELLIDLPPTLHFHTLDYAQKVYSQSFLLCRSEELEQEDCLMVRTAALFLYTGLTQSSVNFENRSIVIAREVLPLYDYSDRQIDQICNLILSTKTPQDAQNTPEKVLADASLDFLGRPDYINSFQMIFLELKESGQKISMQEFKKQQIEFLTNFNFHTLAGQRLREITGKEQIAKLEQENWK